MQEQVPPNLLATTDATQGRGAPAGCANALDRVVRRLEELDLAQAVVARALLSELGGSARADAVRPLEETVTVTPARLQAYRAVRRLTRHAENIDAFLRHQIAVLRDVTFWAPARPAGQEETPVRFDEVALFDIVEIREWSDDRNPRGDDAGDAAFHWLVRGGLWTGSHLRQPCRHALCRIARASLDPARETTALVALRLGSYAVAQSCPCLARTAMTMTVGEILSAVGRLPAEPLRTVTWGRRTAADLFDAAQSLRRAGIFDDVEMRGLPSEGALAAGAIGDWLNAETTLAVHADAP